MPAKLLQTDERALTEEQRRTLVERVASSVELRRAARLRAFLLYVCDQTLTHGRTVIHEQEIGAAVFGRPAGYDTSIDNIVRVNATELRKRLEHFFAEEGQAEESILEIQRGSYTPTFRRRTVETAAARNAQPPVPTAAPQAPVAPPIPAHAWNLADSAIPAAPLSPGPSLAPPALEPEPGPKAPAQAAVRNRLHVWQALSVLLLIVCVALAWQLHSFP